jgi:MscS family membrane protein
MIAAAWFDFMTETQFLGNALWQWAALLGVLLLSLVTGKIVSFFLLHSARRMDEIPDRFILLSLFVKAMAPPLSLMTLAIALYISSSFMSLRYTTDTGETIPLLGYWLRAAHTISVLAVAWFIFRMVAVVEHYLSKWTSKTQTTLDDQLVPLLRKSLRVLVVIIAVLFIAQNIFEWNVGALVAGLGIGGLAFALAAKDMLANLFGSGTIFADRPFQLGDRINVKGNDGVVEEVGFRSTRIRLLNGHVVSVPNASVANEPVENVSLRPHLKRVLNVTVTYSTSPEKLQRGVEILREMVGARTEHFDPDRPPKVFFNDFNADSLNIVVYYWFAPPDWWAYLEFNHEFNMELLRRFNEEGIEFAFPTQTLYVKQDSPLEAEVRLRQTRDERA